MARRLNFRRLNFRRLNFKRLFFNRFSGMSIIAIAIFMLINLPAIRVYAADAQVRFGSNYYTKNQGERFPIGLYVENADGSAAGIGNYHIELSYNANILQFSDGANLAEAGKIILDGTGDGNTNKTFLYFVALYGGNANVTVTSATILDTNGTEMNVVFLGNAPVTIEGTAPADGNAQDGQTGNAPADGNAQDGNAQDGNAQDVNAQDGDVQDGQADNPDIVDTDNTEKNDSTETVVEIDKTENTDNTNADGTNDEGTKIPETVEPVVEQTVEEVVDSSIEDTTEPDSSNSHNSVLRYIIIALACIVGIVCIVFVIRGIIHIVSRRKQITQKNSSGEDSHAWAFEFDTIDDDKDQAGDFNSNSIHTYTDKDMTDFNNRIGGEADEEDYIFEFDSIPIDDD